MGTLADGDWVAKLTRGHDDQGFDGWVETSEGQDNVEFPVESGRTHPAFARSLADRITP